MKTKTRTYLNGFWFGIRRVFAQTNEDAEKIYATVAKTKEGEDPQDVNAAITREDYDAETEKFYPDLDLHQCDKQDSMYTVVEVEVEEPEVVEAEEGGAPNEVDEYRESEKQKALEQAIAENEQNEANPPVDPDMQEHAESAQRNIDGVTTVPETEEGTEEESPGTLTEAINAGTDDETILKRPKDEFTETATQLGVDAAGTKASVLQRIKETLQTNQ